VSEEFVLKRTGRSVIDKVMEEKAKMDFFSWNHDRNSRACLTANEIGEVAEFFSFGTNDLTQMGFGYSRDDAGKFLPIILKRHFKSGSVSSIGSGRYWAIDRNRNLQGRAVNSKLK
jgi:pyruvate,orthophosphate dikinase